METQNIEYKELWRDEYLKWICGFANAQGGTMFIGVNDEGNVIGKLGTRHRTDDPSEPTKRFPKTLVQV